MGRPVDPIRLALRDHFGLTTLRATHLPRALVEQLASCKDDGARRILLGIKERADMKDALGNELKVGNMVALQLARPLIFGQIIEVEEGGLVTGVNHRGGADIRPGRVVVISRHVIDADPRMRVEALMALRNDEGHQAVEEPVEKTVN